MRRAAFSICLLVLVSAAVGCGGSEGESGNKSTLIVHIEEGLEERGAPPALTGCIENQLNASLNNAEVEKAYEQLPSNPQDASPGEVAEAMGPRSLLATVEAGSKCAKQLVRSGKFTSQEVTQFFEKLQSHRVVQIIH